MHDIVYLYTTAENNIDVGDETRVSVISNVGSDEKEQESAAGLSDSAMVKTVEESQTLSDQ